MDTKADIKPLTEICTIFFLITPMVNAFRIDFHERELTNYTFIPMLHLMSINGVEAVAYIKYYNSLLTMGSCKILLHCFVIICVLVCSSGKYGMNCTSDCSTRHCDGNQRCEHVNGKCEDGCQRGWEGQDCIGKQSVDN